MLSLVQKPKGYTTDFLSNAKWCLAMHRSFVLKLYSFTQYFVLFYETKKCIKFDGVSIKIMFD